MDQLWNSYRRNSTGWKSDRIAKVHPRIMVGSAYSLNNNLIKTLNITHMVNCADDDVSIEPFVDETPHRHVCIQALDSNLVNITDWYPKFEYSMNRFLADPECSVVYVHCECGINRSAFLTLIYMCLKFGYNIRTVAKSMLIQRPCMFTNPEFQKQVVEYIKKHQ